ANRDDLVQRRDGDELTFEHVAASLGLAHQKLGPPADHLKPMAEEFLHQLLDVKGPRPAVDESQKDNACRLLQWRKLIELVEHQMRIGVALEVHDNAHRLAVASAGLIAHGGNTFDALVLDQVADFFCQAVAGLLIRHLTADNLRAVSVFDDLRPCPERDFAPAGEISFEDALPAANDATGWIVGARDDFHQLFNADVGIIDEADESIADLTQVVGWDFGRHAHRNAVGAVHE